MGMDGFSDAPSGEPVDVAPFDAIEESEAGFEIVDASDCDEVPQSDIVVEEDFEPDIVEEEFEPDIVEEKFEPDIVDKESEPKVAEDESEPDVVEKEPEPEVAEEEPEPDAVEEESESEVAEQESEPGIVEEESTEVEISEDAATPVPDATEVEDGGVTDEVEPEASEEDVQVASEEESAESTEQQLRFGELEPNAVYTRNGYEYQTDEQGRVSFVSGQLELEEGTRTQHQTEVGKQGMETDEGGHFLGTRFKGSPEGMNLFPQDANFNRGVYKSMENEWADALKEGKDVEVAIQPVYLEDDNRPIGVEAYYVIDNESTTRVFYNEPGGGLR